MSESPTHYIDKTVGSRYASCTLDGFDILTDAHAVAVEQCRDYVMNFYHYLTSGQSLVLLGPCGTGKDHLMIAVARGICRGYARSMRPPSAMFKKGMPLIKELEEAHRDFKQDPTDKYKILNKPSLLCLSDPIPTTDELTKDQKEIILTVIDGRYSERRPIAATLNVSSRKEMSQRLGPQSTDRLLDNAVVVKCNWQSYRQRKPESAGIAGRITA